MSSSTYAVILAGGSGRRFWPLSRDAKPKQLLHLFDDSTLLEQTLERLRGLVPQENILILTNREQEDAVRALLPGHPAENILAEPVKRDTAPAIALGIGWVVRRDPNATMMVLPADQLIKDTAAFHACMTSAVEVASRTPALVTIGIKPTWACPSFGYVERGRRAFISGLQHPTAVYEVSRFREKPNPDLAEEFLARGNFSWNAGMFIWSLPTVVHELTTHCPQLMHFVAEIRRTSDVAATIAAQFPEMSPISIDYALMEHATRVLNIEATFDWDDVGSWISVGKYLPADVQHNSANSPLAQIESTGNIVFTEANTQVALLGVQDLIIVQTGDALLIADKHSADAIKKLVDLVPKNLH
ncbi:MAG: NTP transferase domain-containing protein [Verrucomicrobiales bacterium]|nr:NTP transferase domain-containing protein [Verrucomicrobiales bacterium]